MANSSSSSNTSAALSYLLGFITGFYFFLTSKDKFVRFNALQSIIASLGVVGINFVLNMVGLYMLTSIIGIGSLVLFIFLIFQAYQGKEFKIPIVGDIASKNA